MNVYRFRSTLCLSFILAAICSTAYATDLILNNVPVKVCFCPGRGCIHAIIHEINNAKTEILVQAYSFTSANLAKALQKAYKRGVKVQAILDEKRQRTANHSAATFLADSGIPTFVDAAHHTAHNKIIIIDGCTVITGSLNFGKTADEKRAENLLIIKSEELAKIYKGNWNHHREHSEQYAPKY